MACKIRAPLRAPMTDAGGDVEGQIGAQRLIDGGHEPLLHQEMLHEVVGLDAQLFGKLLDCDAFGDGDLAIDRRLLEHLLAPRDRAQTTLFRLLLGQLSPVAGSLTVFGARPRTGDPRIGYIPQSSTFDADFSIRGQDFVELGVDGHRWGVPLLDGAAKRRLADDAIVSVEATA